MITEQNIYLLDNALWDNVHLWLRDCREILYHRDLPRGGLVGNIPDYRPDIMYELKGGFELDTLNDPDADVVGACLEGIKKEIIAKFKGIKKYKQELLLSPLSNLSVQDGKFIMRYYYGTKKLTFRRMIKYWLGKK